MDMCNKEDIIGRIREKKAKDGASGKHTCKRRENNWTEGMVPAEWGETKHHIAPGTKEGTEVHIRVKG